MTQKLEWLLDQLDESRADVLMSLEMLPDEALLWRGAIGDWSVADLLVILTAWESELVTAMMNMEKGKKPDKLLKAMSERERYNKRLASSTSERMLDLVFDDWQRVRMKLETWLEVFSERDLTDKKRFKWLKGKSLYTIVLEFSVKLERYYLPQLQAFADQWRMAEDQQIILPTTIPIHDSNNK